MDLASDSHAPSPPHDIGPTELWSNSRPAKKHTKSIEDFDKLRQVGEGTYGQVYKARNRHTGDIVALKRIRMDNEREGFPITAIREIKILQRLEHKNIVRLKEIVVSKGSVYMVLEYMDHDLTGLLQNPEVHFDSSQIKCYMRQVLEGLHFLHSKSILHRDIKGSNLLYNNHGEVKLADFGLARWFTDDNRKYTNRVITLWYRPPELLLGVSSYGAEIDVWSAGCILVELYSRKPLFQGNDEIAQLDSIYRVCGIPNEHVWPGVSKTPLFNTMRPKQYYRPRLKEEMIMRGIHGQAIDLTERMIVLDPKKRISVAEALNHPYFTEEDPLPCSIDAMPVISTDCHEYESKMRKKKETAERLATKNAMSSQSEGNMDISPVPPGPDEAVDPTKSKHHESAKGPMFQAQPRGESAEHL